MKDILDKIRKEVEIENNTLVIGSAQKNTIPIRSYEKSNIDNTTDDDFNLLIVSSDDKLNKTSRIIWNNVAYGGYVIITDVNTPQIENRILAFLKSKEKYYFRKRRMMVNGVRENFLCFKIYNPNKRKKVVENALMKQNDIIKIACVLRKSKDYTVRDVNLLAKNVKKHFSRPHEFVAIVDDAKGINHNLVDRIIPSIYNYPSWWCKLELFRPDVFNTDDRIIYFDLDTAIVDNIDFMADQTEPFVGLRDFYNMFNFASGVMSWVGAAGHHLDKAFERNNKKVMADFKREGDQKFISNNVYEYSFWQDLFPNKIISFKKDMKEQNIREIPEETSVICFHGKPKLLDCNNVNILNRINN